MSTGPRPIVIVGLPRSGTTWSFQALWHAMGMRRIAEPDNEDKNPAAIHGKHGLGRYPSLVPGDRSPAYHRLWEWILTGGYETRRSRTARRIMAPGADDRIFDGRLDPVTWLAATVARDPRPGRGPAKGVPTQPVPAGQPVLPPEDLRVITKSIHAQLAITWLSAEFDIDVLVLLRHPANVLASWMKVNLKDARNTTLETRPEIRSRFVEPWGVPLPGPDPVERMCWRIGLLVAALEEAVASNPQWRVASHEALCLDPFSEFRTLYDQLGLEWSPATEEYLRSHDRRGEGFQVTRVASELPDAWQRRLDDDHLATLRRVLAWFPITQWTDQDFERTPSSG